MDEIKSRSHCEQCALGRHCFTETQSHKAFRAMVRGHQHYNANQVIYSEGSATRYVAVVQSGAVKLVRNDQVIGFALPVTTSVLHASMRIFNTIPPSR